MTDNPHAPPTSQSDEALVECPKCESYGDDCGEHAPTWVDLALYWKAQCEASQAREASARTEGRREGIEEAAKVAEGVLGVNATAIRALTEKQP